MGAIAVAASFLLCGYEFIRSASSSLFLNAYGSKRLPIVMALGPVCTILLVYVYGLLLSLLGACRALLMTSGLSALVIAACYVAVKGGSALATGVAYVFREAYIVVLVEQYWSFINSTVSHREGRGLNGPIAGIASVGAILGATLVGVFAGKFGTETFLLLAAASLVPAAICAAGAYYLGGEPKPSEREAGGKQGHLAIGLFGRSSYLVLLLLLIGTTQVVSTVLDLRLNQLVMQEMPRKEVRQPDGKVVDANKDVRTGYFGRLYRDLNIGSMLLEFIGAPAALYLLPLRVVHGAIPLVHFCTGLVLLLRPSLGVGAVAYLVFKAFDYSVFRAGKEIFYIPLSFDERYRAKSVIDAFGYRVSKGVAAGVIALVGLVSRIPGGAYAVTAMACAGVWFFIVAQLCRRYRELAGGRQ